MRPDSIASLRRTIACCATLLLVACSDGGPTGPGGGGTPVVVDVQFIVDSIRAAYDLPALGGAIVTVDPAASRVAVAGARRVAGPQVTPQDLWHLGSNFKAFTGMLAAIAVDDGAIAWTTTVTDAFPELSGSVRAEYADVTLRELLSHRSGVPRDPAAGSIVGSTREQQRNGVAAWALAQPMASTRGTYSYTNTGYMIAAAMVERALGVTFEDAMAARVFTPLGITSAGWGPQALAGSTNQPVAHTLVNGQWVARENFDNPPVYASAGGAHMSIDAWSRFLREILRLEAGSPTIVSVAAGSETTRSITTIAGSDGYGLGWLVTSRSWANGRTLTHDGTNTGNHSVTWMAPGRGFAVLGVTNAYDPAATARTARALDALAGRLIAFHNTGG
jgi:CubicO group peptidase (beta-lactamase class C family)